MRRIITFFINYYKQIATGTIFTIGGVIIIFLFPWQGKFRYEYQKGKPWQHEEYFAPFDFPIF